MSKPAPADVREVILTVVQDHERQASSGGARGTLQQGTVLDEVARRLGVAHITDHHVAILTLWNDLFRSGYLGWGLDLGNPNPPFFHVTDRGHKALERVSRDPGNPAGYLRHLHSAASINPVAQSYLSEGLECFATGLYKAAAVMLGGAAESIVLELRDTTLTRTKALGIAPPKGVGDLRLKKILDGLNAFLASKAGGMPHDLREAFEADWPALTHQIRVTRNDAGHPANVDAVLEDGVHASFMLFPELARLATRLSAWVGNDLQ
jgi:hypothetical protein